MVCRDGMPSLWMQLGTMVFDGNGDNHIQIIWCNIPITTNEDKVALIAVEEDINLIKKIQFVNFTEM